MDPSRRMAAGGAAAIIAVYFVTMAAPGLVTYFNADDVTNLYTWWPLPVGQIVQANLNFFTGVRPLGGAYYVAMFHLFGFHEVPFTAVRCALLLLNLGIAGRVARRITGSTEAALLSCLVFAYHGALADLYGSTGTIYDILCFTFYFAALSWYLGIRLRDRAPKWPELAGLLLLLVAALNSKEMAVSFPVVIGAWELLHWRQRSLRGPVVTGLAVALFLIGRLAIRGPLAGMTAYTPVLGLERFSETSLSYLSQLFYAWPPGWFTPLRAFLLVAAMLALALVRRSKPLAFSCALGILAVLPMSFVPPRSGYVLYLPFLGWATYAGVLLRDARQALSKGIPASGLMPVQAGWFLAVLVSLAWVHVQCRARVMSPGPGGTAEMRSMVRQLSTLYPSFPPRSRILFRNEPFEDYTSLSLLRLYYRDDSLDVVSLKRNDLPPGAADEAKFDYIFDYRNEWFSVVKAKTPPASERRLTASLRPWVRMRDPNAPAHLLRDVAGLEGNWFRWTGENPELQFVVRPAAAHSLSAEFTINDTVFRQTGPQTVSFYVNGKLLDSTRYTSPGEKVFRKPVPAGWLEPGRITRVGMRIEPPYVAPADGVKLGVVLVTVGFLE